MSLKAWKSHPQLILFGRLLRLASEAKVEVRLEGPNAGEVETQLRGEESDAWLVRAKTSLPQNSI